MRIYWGVVSSHATNSTVHTATGDSTLFGFVTQKTQSPQFWGRYISGKDPKYLSTPEEATFIFKSTGGNCRIPVVHYGITPAGDYQTGVNDALNAIEAAQNLGVPPGVAIYSDIEVSMLVSLDWLFGWWETMSSSVYGNPGGFYCNPSLKNAANYMDPYCAAITDPRNVNPDFTYRFNPPLFSSSPQIGRSFDTSSYGPDESPCVPGSAVIWQYAQGCFRDTNYPRGLCDMDLANDDGYATMWSSQGYSYFVSFRASLVSEGTESPDLISVDEPEDEILEEPDGDLPVDVRQRATRDERGKVLSGRQRGREALQHDQGQVPIQSVPASLLIVREATFLLSIFVKLLKLPMSQLTAAIDTTVRDLVALKK